MKRSCKNSARGIGVAKHVYCGGEGFETEVISDGIVIDEQNNGTARAISFLYISLPLDAKQYGLIIR